MTKVTYQTLFSESRNNVLSLISNSSNVVDPTISSAEFRKWIYSREPDVKAADFSGYPFIIVNPVDFELGKQGSVNGKSKPINWEIEIEVVTSDRGYGGKDGQALAHMDAISDDIIQTMLNWTNRKTLQGQSMYNVQVTTSKVVPDVIGEELVYRRSFIVGLSSRMQVSA